MAYNILTKRLSGKEYIITDMIATTLSKSKFEALQALNTDLLGGYTWTAQADTDFSWWARISKKLTARKIVTAYFDINFYGKVTEV